MCWYDVHFSCLSFLPELPCPICQRDYLLTTAMDTHHHHRRAGRNEINNLIINIICISLIILILHFGTNQSMNYEAPHNQIVYSMKGYLAVIQVLKPDKKVT